MSELYSERGLSRVWLFIAPVLTIAVIVTQGVVIGEWSDWWMWLLLGGLSQLFVWLQVTAGRTHVSVALTPEELRCGEESIPVDEIAEILPGKMPDHPKKAKPEEFPSWSSARVMGKLQTVPRRRYGMGLKLTDGSTVQAWARNDYALRAALAPLL
ncbi:hypothetical protein TPAU25S_02148 [Tsukamurella paurometabola]|uniref:DUF3093 domain-containing protein n=1 Tax=Tsukamurella paurometabola (strain ATCC 8368 / DSM 20162 / CCUG 35730 / CIP 100753 / JCM 10117 / KCTC 9821 / NBRC 16120 / NCIMB 702349 / NCTC 13040) TaxID=521096 RepID=D5UT22_TSUPD|nr:DUF3093 family protein [Tsukamurella paurometabola]ADG77309.1 conserved hypothetical protein [Tsukamurella paurometabola DSM 20162]SUP43453.1 Protein of uncharacterised function (DUF3093) [Tsukamurella paurometabola]